MTAPALTPALDFEISSGSIWRFVPITDAAWDHAADYLDDAESHCGAYLVEPRYALDIVADLVNEHGFAVAIDGREVAEITSA